jgi:hypothetical protein
LGGAEKITVEPTGKTVEPSVQNSAAIVFGFFVQKRANFDVRTGPKRQKSLKIKLKFVGFIFFLQLCTGQILLRCLCSAP